MLFAVTIWNPGQVVLFLGLVVALAYHFSKKYLSDDVKDAAKKAAASKAISLIGKWLK